jgi:2-keto-4-pentenoate hydratase
MRPPETPPTGVETVARALAQARRRGEPVPSAELERLLASPVDAYEVQALVARECASHPDGVPRFWKSGGPSRPALLTHAPLPDAGVWPSPARANGWHFNFVLVEAEIALRLAREVTPALAASLDQAGAAGLVGGMTASIELVDSRWREGVQAAALLKLADLQSHGALVLGEWRKYEPRDWAAQACEVRIADAAPQVFRGTHALGDPAWLLPAWLRHATRDGASVPAGTVVTTGTWCGMLPARPGDLVRAAFPGVGTAEVQL